MSVRRRLLQTAFNLLYGPLVFLHEPAGIGLFGAAWHGRRLATLDLIESNSPVLDLGCGCGHVLRAARERGLGAIGIDASARMLAQCSRMDLDVVRADAAVIPLVDDSIGTVVCTYPGAWIRNPAVWSEIERVASPGAMVVVLLGGDVSRGRGSGLRTFLARLTYGSGDVTLIDFEPPLVDDSYITGQLEVLEDEWGTQVRWIGRIANS